MVVLTDLVASVIFIIAFLRLLYMLNQTKLNQNSFQSLGSQYKDTEHEVLSRNIRYFYDDTSVSPRILLSWAVEADKQGRPFTITASELRRFCQRCQDEILNGHLIERHAYTKTAVEALLLRIFLTFELSSLSELEYLHMCGLHIDLSVLIELLNKKSNLEKIKLFIGFGRIRNKNLVPTKHFPTILFLINHYELLPVLFALIERGYMAEYEMIMLYSVRMNLRHILQLYDGEVPPSHEIIAAIFENAENETISLLLDRGLSPNVRFSHSMHTLLMCQAVLESRDLNLATRLLDMGVPANAQDADLNTALDYADIRGRFDLALLLFRRGARISSMKQPQRAERIMRMLIIPIYLILAAGRLDSGSVLFLFPFELVHEIVNMLL